MTWKDRSNGERKQWTEWHRAVIFTCRREVHIDRWLLCPIADRHRNSPDPTVACSVGASCSEWVTHILPRSATDSLATAFLVSFEVRGPKYGVELHLRRTCPPVMWKLVGLQ